MKVLPCPLLVVALISVVQPASATLPSQRIPGLAELGAAFFPESVAAVLLLLTLVSVIGFVLRKLRHRATDEQPDILAELSAGPKAPRRGLTAADLEAALARRAHAHRDQV
jgi:hypothetical protein